MRGLRQNSVLRHTARLSKERRNLKLKNLLSVTDEEWENALTVFITEAKLDPQVWVRQMSTVQLFVFSIMRAHEIDIAVGALQMYDDRVAVYEDELLVQLDAVGCGRRAVVLRDDGILRDIRERCKSDAVSIANTYNHDVARSIVATGLEAPTANRYVYAYRLRKYLESREIWKDRQIALYTTNWARTKAQHDFYALNRLVLGYAVLVPVRAAVCDICRMLIARGRIPLQLAMSIKVPVHPNCPHEWRVWPQRVTLDQCPLLWAGG